MKKLWRKLARMLKPKRTYLKKYEYEKHTWRDDLMFCITTGFTNACVEQINPDGTYTIGPGGCVD